jgi:hypothetical protein
MTASIIFRSALPRERHFSSVYEAFSEQRLNSLILDIIAQSKLPLTNCSHVASTVTEGYTLAQKPHTEPPCNYEERTIVWASVCVFISGMRQIVHKLPLLRIAPQHKPKAMVLPGIFGYSCLT